jgi:hypothetical protein
MGWNKAVDMNLGMDEKPGTGHPWQAFSVSAQRLPRQPNLSWQRTTFNQW